MLVILARIREVDREARRNVVALEVIAIDAGELEEAARGDRDALEVEFVVMMFFFKRVRDLGVHLLLADRGRRRGDLGLHRGDLGLDGSGLALRGRRLLLGRDLGGGLLVDLGAQLVQFRLHRLDLIEQRLGRRRLMLRLARRRGRAVRDQGSRRHRSEQRDMQSHLSYPLMFTLSERPGAARTGP